MSITIVSCSHDSSGFNCKHIANRIRDQHKVPFDFILLLEIDYLTKLEELKKQYGGKFHGVTQTHCVYVTHSNGKVECVGGLNSFINYATSEYALIDAESGNTASFEHSARIETSQLMQKSGNLIVFIDFIDGGKRTAKSPEYGQIVIELYDKLCPIACANFVKLCLPDQGKEALYVNCPISRLVPGGWFQCGDTVDGSGANSVSAINSPKFEDESFSVKFNSTFGGILGYVSSGPHSNGSQFFVTLGDCSWMDNKFVGFGRVLQGYDTMKRIEKAPTRNQRPSPFIKIGSCGKQGVAH